MALKKLLGFMTVSKQQPRKQPVETAQHRAVGVTPLTRGLLQSDGYNTSQITFAENAHPPSQAQIPPKKYFLPRSCRNPSQPSLNPPLDLRDIIDTQPATSNTTKMRTKNKLSKQPKLPTNDTTPVVVKDKNGMFICPFEDIYGATHYITLNPGTDEISIPDALKRNGSDLKYSESLTLESYGDQIKALRCAADADVDHEEGLSDKQKQTLAELRERLSGKKSEEPAPSVAKNKKRVTFAEI